MERCEQYNTAHRKRVNELEGRLGEIEAHNRGCNVILSGKTLSGLSSDNHRNSVAQLLRSKIIYELSHHEILSNYRIRISRHYRDITS